MNIKIFNKTLLVAMLGVSLVACDNSTASTTNSVSPTEVSTEDNNDQSDDMIDQSMEDAGENKAAESKKTEDGEDDSPKNEDSKEENKKDESKKDTTIENKDNKETNNTDKTENKSQTSSENSTVDTKKDEEQTSKTDKTADNTAPAEEAPQENTNSNTQDGSYVTTLIASKQGVRDPEMSIADAYSVEAENGALTVKGSLDYRDDPKNYDDVKELENNTYSFTINENTKFQAVGGMAEPKNFTAEEFNEYYKTISESGLALIIEVKDGVVQTASFSS